jgi:tetratricopeptide (TPR) repeat protein
LPLVSTGFRSRSATLERAAVIGKEFTRAAIAELGGDSALLAPLVRKELIRPERSSFGGDDDFHFRHLLVRDAAYEAIPKELRAELHERFANWAETQRSEYDEIVGYHLEQAYRYKEQLGTIDEDLARRAASRLADAGRRADARGDPPAVENLLGRATALMQEDSLERLELLLLRASALHAVAEPTEATALLEETIRQAQARGERALELRAALILQSQQAWMNPEGAAKAIKEAAEAAIAELGDLGDDRALGEAWATLSFYYVEQCNAARVADASDHVLFHAKRAGDRRLEHEALTMRALAAWLGSTPVDDAISIVEEVLSDLAAASNRSSEAFVWIFLAELYSQRGDHEAARRYADRSHERNEELGNRRFAAGNTMTTAYCDLRAGDPVAAETRLRPRTKYWRKWARKASAAASRPFWPRPSTGRTDSTRRNGSSRSAKSSPRRPTSSCRSGGVRSKQSCWHAEATKRRRSGSHGKPSRAEPTDLLFTKGEAREALGETFGLVEQVDEARTAFERALELYEQKGSIADAARVSARLASLGSPVGSGD